MQLPLDYLSVSQIGVPAVNVANGRSGFGTNATLGMSAFPPITRAKRTSVVAWRLVAIYVRQAAKRISWKGSASTDTYNH
jgi:hypothetical protein